MRQLGKAFDLQKTRKTRPYPKKRRTLEQTLFSLINQALTAFQKKFCSTDLRQPPQNKPQNCHWVESEFIFGILNFISENGR